MNQKSLIIGIIITIVWFVGIYLFCSINEFSFSNKDLNSLGDFLAGIFAPVAFFWLILGYVQQGKQLEQNTKALEQQERALQLQIEEMKEAVQQQKEMVNIHNQELQTKFLSVKPLITCLAIKAEIVSTNSAEVVFKTFNLSIETINEGREDANEIEFTTEKRFLKYIKTLNKRQIQKIDLIFREDEFFIQDGILETKFNIKYYNIFDQSISQSFLVTSILSEDEWEREYHEVYISATN
ncbi:hypothetical protein [Acinetobacter terrae]|uniref:hypothetical protein n=1 Tax=Acinetobacter terrae TaxID=2731247 RepID=UPI001BC8861A|nr:hypothetical protein [Acinetobacter terrae]